MATTKKHMYRRKSTKSTKKRTMRRVSRRPRLVITSDPTVQKIIVARSPIYRVAKSLQLNRPYATTTAGTCGFQIAYQGTAFSGGYNMLFDPAGTFGNNSGLASSSTVIANAAQVPDWTNLKALYAYYKVTKITLNFQLTTVGNQQTQPMVLYMRYLKEYNAPTPTLNTMSGENSWIKKTFTDEQPNFKYSFVPKVVNFEDNLSALSTDARQLKTMGWTATTTPAELYGFKIYFDYPTVASADYHFISCDITYHMIFRENV